MDYYLRQATLIKKIAKKSNPDIQIDTSATAPVSVQSNALTFGNTNDTDYYEQSKSLLTNFIQDPDKLDQIIDNLNETNDKYLKELTLNFPVYEQSLQSLKGSVVSVNRVVDLLKDKLDTSLGKKNFNNSVDVNSFPIIEFFFNISTQTMNNLEDSKPIVKQILGKILGLSSTSNDKTLLKAIDTAITGKNKDIRRLLTQYKTALESGDKDNLIKNVLNAFETHYSTMIPEPIFDSLIAQTNNISPEVFRENVSIPDKIIDYSKIEKSLAPTNMYFINKLLTVVNEFNDKNYAKLQSVNNLKDDLRKKLIDIKQEDNENAFKEQEAYDRKQKEIANNYIKAKEKGNNMKQVFDRITADKDFNEEAVRASTELLQNVFTKIENMTQKKLSEVLIFLNLLDSDGNDYKVLNQALPRATRSNIAKIEDLRTEKKKLFHKYLSSVKQRLFNYDNSGYNIIMYIILNGVSPIGANKQKSNNASNDLHKLLKIIEMDATEIDKLIDSEINQYKVSFIAPVRAKIGIGLKASEKVVNNKYYVNEDLLKNHGILEIRYVKNRHLAHVKPPMLSEKCKGCVTDMINGGKIKSDHFVSLNQFEKDLLRKIDKLFNTNQDLNDDDEENFHKNFELLKGSYLAGNDSHMVKQQLRQYINHAYEIGKISRYNRDKILMELKLL